MALAIRSTSKERKSITSGRVITKSYDMGDPTLSKKFSFCYISYKMEGSGVSPLVVSYKVNNAPNWTVFKNDENNYYSDSSGNLRRTDDLVKTASFRFEDPSLGRKVSIKIHYETTNSTGTKISGFELSDISFTYRLVQRK